MFRLWRKSPTKNKIISQIASAIINDNDDTYDLHFDENNNYEDSFELASNDAIRCIYVKSVVASKKNTILRKFVRVGHVLLKVNGHLVYDANEDIDDIMTYLLTLKQSKLQMNLTFLNTSKCSLNNYLDKTITNVRIKKDLFGFNRTLDYLLSEKYHMVSKGYIHSQRDLEWVEYLKSVGGADNLKPCGIFQPNKELKALVRRGIPVAFRALVWQKISLSSIHRRDFPADYYQTLLTRFNEIDPHVIDDIEKDIDRTFPEHDYFVGKGNGEECLRRVLLAYAVHNPDIGYCQSLNFVCGIMLIFMEEEDSFWLLLTIIETLLPEDYYTRTMIGTYTDQYVLAELIKEYLPTIHCELENAQLQLPLVTVQWFMCLFVNTLRPEIALRVWDMFLNEGSKVLFRIAVALFKLNEKLLISATDPGDLFLKLRDIGRDILDGDDLISCAYKSFKVSHSKSVSNSSSATNINSLPKELTGIGLAHLGPVYLSRPIINGEYDNITAVPITSSSKIQSSTLQSTKFSEDFNISCTCGDDSLISSEEASFQSSPILSQPDDAVELQFDDPISDPISLPTFHDSNSPNKLTDNTTTEDANNVERLVNDIVIDESNRNTSSNYAGFGELYSSRETEMINESIKDLRRRRSVTSVQLQDGTFANVLVADVSSKRISQSRPISLKRMSSLNNVSSTEKYRSFKRKDIELLRVKHRVEVIKQFEIMESSRRRWREQQESKDLDNGETGNDDLDESDNYNESDCEDDIYGANK